ncbi:hypothetical protein HDE_10261 [Halotydeus destructor]|nr:hypothetical protein HDE_10261 [Halotydeus destructor]
MKPIVVFVMASCAMFVSAFEQSSQADNEILIREPRGVLETFNCIRSSIAAAARCNDELDARTKNVQDSMDKKCCWNAEFRLCVAVVASKECDKDDTETIDAIIRGLRTTVVPEQCKSYTPYDPVCIYVVYFDYIVVIGFLLAILLIGCCLGAICCR